MTEPFNHLNLLKSAVFMGSELRCVQGTTRTLCSYAAQGSTGVLQNRFNYSEHQQISSSVYTVKFHRSGGEFQRGGKKNRLIRIQSILVTTDPLQVSSSYSTTIPIFIIRLYILPKDQKTYSKHREVNLRQIGLT